MRVETQIGLAKRCCHRIANSLDNDLNGRAAKALDLLVPAVCGVFPKKPIAAHCGNDLQRIQGDPPTLGEQLEYKPLDHRKRKLAKVAIMDQEDCGHLFSRSATSLTKAMDDPESRSIAVKLVHLGKKQINRLDKCRETLHPDISRSAFFNRQDEFGTSVRSGKTEQPRPYPANPNGRVESLHCRENFVATARDVD